MTVVLEVAVPVTTMWADPDAPRPVDRAAVGDPPDDGAWVGAMTAEEASTGLHGRTDTQLLLGEPVELLEERGDWVRGAALWQPRPGTLGYPGWVRRAHLAEPVPLATGPSATVATRVAVLTTDLGRLPISLATVLWVGSTSPTDVDVHLPGGRTGRLARADVALSHKEEPATFRPHDVLGAAHRFLGLRYLWAGTSGWGVDCSGLVHLAFRAQRIVVPRDAADQASWEGLTQVPVDAVRPGDLYFFAHPGRPVHHVGFVTSPVAADGGRTMLHAPEGRYVEDAPIATDREALLCSAGRVSPQKYAGWPAGSRPL